jgi:hypothetical protein
MELTNVNLYAEGHYSHKVKEENVFITTESFLKMENNINGIVVHFHELDGKHSCTEGDVSATSYTEEELLVMNIEEDFKSNCDRLEEVLEEIFDEHELDFKAEKEKVKEYLATLDNIVEVSVKLKKSQLTEIQTLTTDLDTLLKEYVALKENASRDECHDCEYKYRLTNGEG